VADWRAVEAVSRTLQAILQRQCDRALGAGMVRVQILSPASFDQLATTNELVVTVFLYRIEENRITRNQQVRVDLAGRRLRQPVTLELCYHITVWAARPSSPIPPATDETATREEQRIFGLLFQAIVANAELGSAELVNDEPVPVFSPDDTVQLVLESIPFEDQERLWKSANLTYRLSLQLRARVVGIEPEEVAADVPVVTSAIRLGEQ
jgi:hypothetical protein